MTAVVCIDMGTKGSEDAWESVSDGKSVSESLGLSDGVRLNVSLGMGVRDGPSVIFIFKTPSHLEVALSIQHPPYWKTSLAGY